MSGYNELMKRGFVILVLISLSACAANPGSVSEPISVYDDYDFAQAAFSYWEQVNLSGFGSPQEREISALEAFNGYLYAGTHNLIEQNVVFDGARIFRSPDGVTWSPVTQPGFQNPHDTAPPAILDFVVFGNRLYASTGRGGNPAQIWRSTTGTIWSTMVTAGFGDPDIHDIASLAVFNNMIYAGAGSQVSGAKIYRSSSGDSNTWNPVAPAASTMAGAEVTGLEEFNGALFAVIESEAPVQLWQSTGGAWTSVMSNGFGDSNTRQTGGMAVFGGYLYIGAGNSVSGAQLWRSNNGTSWAPAIPPGFGDPNNKTVEMVFVFQNQLYIGVQNDITGIEIWRSADGMSWEQDNQDGFGDVNNATTNGSNATTEFLTWLYTGTSNTVDGGELWRMPGQTAATPTPTATDTSVPTATPTDTATAIPTPTETPTATPTTIDVPTNTPTFTPTATDTPMETATSTPSPTSTGANPSTDTPTNTPTSTPTNTPTLSPEATATPTFTLTPTFTPTDTPSPTPTFTPTPLSNTPGRVTGGGTIGSSRDNLKITFGFTIRYDEGDSAPRGNLTLQDHKTNLRLKAEEFDLLVIEGDHAVIIGTGELEDGRMVRFQVEVREAGNSGQPASFYLRLLDPNEYEVGGDLAGGNITIH